MKITNEQKNFILSEFTCERLSCNKKNKDLIKNITNKENSALVNILQNSAWNIDQANKTAFYIIKDRDNHIPLFFSLQTGCIFDSQDSFTERKRILTILLSALQARTDLDAGKNIIIAEKFLKEQNLYDLDQNQLKKQIEKTQRIIGNKKIDTGLPQNKSIYRVVHTYPSIELHVFCKNDAYKDSWEKKTSHLNLPENKRMGEIFFWTFVVEIIRKTQAIVGCEYIHLFAANNPKKDELGHVIENRSLLGYYETKLKFEENKELATTKPSFDYACVFMTQKISDLYEHQKEFFENFNPTKEEMAEAI